MENDKTILRKDFLMLENDFPMLENDFPMLGNDFPMLGNDFQKQKNRQISLKTSDLGKNCKIRACRTHFQSAITRRMRGQNGGMIVFSLTLSRWAGRESQISRHVKTCQRHNP